MTAKQLVNLGKLPKEEKTKALLPICKEWIASAFPQPYESGMTPMQFWCEARFGLYSHDKELSEIDAHFLLSLSEESPEAWDVADLICQRALVSGSLLAKPLRHFILRRLEGKLSRPTQRTGRGNTRNRNLYRDYFIIETLEKLNAFGLTKLHARQLLARAFIESGQRMITVSVVHHVQRNSAKIGAEFQSFGDAETAFHDGCLDP